VGRGSEESACRATIIRQTRTLATMCSQITRHHGKAQSIIGMNHEAAVSKLSNKRRVFMADMTLAVFD
jgi:hypothetical protein